LQTEGAAQSDRTHWATRAEEIESVRQWIIERERIQDSRIEQRNSVGIGQSKMGEFELSDGSRCEMGCRRSMRRKSTLFAASKASLAKQDLSRESQTINRFLKLIIFVFPRPTDIP
jgi:hypothetical protein